MQILSACPELEELTLRPDYGGQPTHPFVCALAQFLNTRASSAITARRLWSVHIDWADAKQPAVLSADMLSALSSVASVTVCAKAVKLEVPDHESGHQAPAALKIVTQRFRLMSRMPAAHVAGNLATFRIQCELTIEGICPNAAERCWEPQYRNKHGKYPEAVSVEAEGNEVD